MAEDGPIDGMPFPPDLLGLAFHQARDDLRRLVEYLRQSVGNGRVAQDIPFRDAAHDRRWDGVNDPANTGLTDAEGAHRARLHIRVDRAPRKMPRSDLSLRVGDRHQFGVPCDIAVAMRPRRRLGDDFIPVADDACKRVLALLDRLSRELDASGEHFQITRRRRRRIIVAVHGDLAARSCTAQRRARERILASHRAATSRGR